MSPEVCECRYCGESFTAAGIKNHEKYCDENPNSGLTHRQQEELGLLDEGETGDATPSDPDPDQSAKSAGAGLPSRTKLPSPDKTTSKEAVATDGGTSECPACGSSDTLSSHEARKEYTGEVDKPLDSALLAFNLSERYCNECFALWGDEFPEPVPLDVAIGAAEDEEGLVA